MRRSGSTPIRPQIPARSVLGDMSTTMPVIWWARATHAVVAWITTTKGLDASSARIIHHALLPMPTTPLLIRSHALALRSSIGTTQPIPIVQALQMASLATVTSCWGVWYLYPIGGRRPLHAMTDAED